MTQAAAGASVRSVVFILSDEIFLLCPPLLSQYEAGAGPCTWGCVSSPCYQTSQYSALLSFHKSILPVFLSVWRTEGCKYQ